MKTTVQCPHGVIVTTEDAGEHHPLEALGPGDANFRSWVRNALLACPRCFFDAEAHIQEPGA